MSKTLFVTKVVTMLALAGSAMAEPWTPSEISPVAWYDAADTSTITDAGGAVSQWNDKSGNDYHLVQTTPANQPTSGSQTLNSTNVIAFDGGDYLAKAFGTTYAQPNIVFAVIDQSNLDAVITDGTSAGTRHALWQWGGVFYLTAASDLTGPTSVTGPRIWTAVFNGASSSLAIDAGTPATGNTGADGLGGITLGARYTANYGLTGTIAEYIVADTNLSAEDRQKVEGYLAHKWGLEGNLPADHPYKAAPPASAAGEITWTSVATPAASIGSDSATATAEVDTDLTQTVLVWEETATAPSPLPGTTNDWSYVSVLGPTNAGTVVGQLTGLAADTQYTWRFFGETASTNGWSSSVTFVTDLSAAQAPVFTSAVAASTSIQLGWQDNAANETGYVLQRSTVEGSGYTTIATLGADTTTHTDAGLATGTTYYYQLAATNSASGGSFTDFSLCRTNATPVAPQWPLPENTGELWYDAADTNTVTPSGGGTVTLWKDKSGNNRDATPSAGNPAYTTGQYVAFDQDSMLIANPFTPSDPQVFAVIQNTGANTLNYFLGSGDSAGGFFSGGTFYTGFGLYSGAATRSDTAHDANLNVVSIDRSSVYRNGTSLAMAEASAGTILVARLGERDAASHVRLIGNIHEIVVFDGVLSTDDRQKVEGYLAHKWGLQGNLPADHPYKAAPPVPSTVSEITWTSVATPAASIGSDSATATAEVDTDLTQTVLVWEETATAPSPLPGTTNDWSYVSVLGPTNAGTVVGQLTGLAADTQYTWRFFGETASTNGWSSSVTFVTDLSAAQAPVFTSAVAASTSIQLGWQDNAANETGYVLQRSTVEGSGYTTIATLGADTTTHTDAGLATGTTYYYQLAATNSASGGSFTDFSLCRTNATPVVPQWPLPEDTGELWYDASDTNTVTPSGGGTVTLWKDKSGNNRDATPSAGNPAYTTGQYVAFDQDSMLIANPFTPADPQVFAVIQNTGANTLNYFLGSGDSAGGFFSGGTFYTGFGLYSGAATRSDTAHDANLNVISIDRSSVYRNGTSLTMAESSAGTILVARLGERDSASHTRLIGNIHELVVFDGVLSTDDRQKVEGYLAHKWMLQGNLPADHPYKAAPPAAPPPSGTVFIFR